MMTLFATLIFAGSFAAAFLAIALTMLGSWPRIVEVMNGTRPSRLPELRSVRQRVPVTLRAVVVRPRQREAA